MELIFILTYNCNFRCSYCDIDKREDDMPEAVLKKSMKFLGDNNFSIEKVKFFGGEPLLKKKEIKHIVNHFPEQYTPKFYVTSNSTLIDDDFIEFTKISDLKLTFSIDGDSVTTTENRKLKGGNNLSQSIIKNTQKYHSGIRVNQVVTSKTSYKFFENFLFIYGLGVREFNFLPEYYREWSKQGLQNLKKGFDEILGFCKDKPDIYLVNSENFSETSFFNLGLIIDTDGSIYGTNLILAGVFEIYKPQLKIGHVDTGLSVDISDISFNQSYVKLVKALLEGHYTTTVLSSVKYVDLILSNFVTDFQKNDKK